MDGKYKAPKVFRWFEARLDPQNWKQYTASLLVFTVLFIFGFLVFALQPFMPLNPLGKGSLLPREVQM
jgi:potassium-transporting ATPase potassium-binding subunit